MEIFIASHLIVVLILLSLVKLVFIFRWCEIPGIFFSLKGFFLRNLCCDHVNICEFLLPVFNMRKKGVGRGEGIRNRHAPRVDFILNSWNKNSHK